MSTHDDAVIALAGVICRTHQNEGMVCQGEDLAHMERREATPQQLAEAIIDEIRSKRVPDVAHGVLVRAVFPLLNELANIPSSQYAPRAAKALAALRAVCPWDAREGL